MRARALVCASLAKVTDIGTRVRRESGDATCGECRQRVCRLPTSPRDHLPTSDPLVERYLAVKESPSGPMSMTRAKRTTRAHPSAPTIREMTRSECERILTRNHIGRVAFTFHDHVDLEPIHYVHARGWLHGRTAPGTKIAILRHHPWVAFEVDEVDGLFDWRSVVVHGAVYIPDPEGSPAEREAYAETLEYVRELVPAALGPADPSPDRYLPFRIHIDTISGRAAEASAKSLTAKPRRRGHRAK